MNDLDSDGLPFSVISQRFCVDCLGLVLPDGSTVIAAHVGDPSLRVMSDRIVGRQRGSFRRLLAVAFDLGNTIVYSCKCHFFVGGRPAAVGRSNNVRGTAN